MKKPKAWRDKNAMFAEDAPMTDCDGTTGMLRFSKLGRRELLKIFSPHVHKLLISHNR